MHEISRDELEKSCHGDGQTTSSSFVAVHEVTATAAWQNMTTKNKSIWQLILKIKFKFSTRSSNENNMTINTSEQHITPSCGLSGSHLVMWCPSLFEVAYMPVSVVLHCIAAKVRYRLHVASLFSELLFVNSWDCQCNPTLTSNCSRDVHLPSKTAAFSKTQNNTRHFVGTQHFCWAVSLMLWCRGAFDSTPNNHRTHPHSDITPI